MLKVYFKTKSPSWPARFCAYTVIPYVSTLRFNIKIVNWIVAVEPWSYFLPGSCLCFTQKGATSTGVAPAPQQLNVVLCQQ